MSNNRLLRVNADIFRVVSIAIGEMDNEDFADINVVEVDTSADFSSVKVFVDIPGPEPKKQKIMEELGKASGLVRSKIAGAISLRRTPAVTFIFHGGRKNADRVHELLEQIRRQGEGVNNPKP